MLWKQTGFFNICFRSKIWKLDGFFACNVWKKSHITCISKILTNLYFTKQRIKTKNTFEKVVYNVLVVKNVLTKHKEVCLSIDGTQSVRLEKEAIEFKKYFKQIPVPFKICVILSVI